MKINEQISALRKENGITQDELAKAIGVSNQAVSKWESGQTCPDLQFLPAIADYFGVSIDYLMGRGETSATPRVSRREYEVILDDPNAPPFESRFFGTDGFRGQANVDVTAMHAFNIGRFVGWFYANKLSGCRIKGYRPKIVIGKDTRRSGYMLEYALAAGLTCSGADAYMLHVTTTPSVSYVTRQEGFDCGIMISASHNAYEDNGIKLINRYGEKMDPRTLAYLESYLAGELKAPDIIDSELPLATGKSIGAIIDHSAGRNRYIAYLISIAAHSYKGLRIGLDCSNGASWMIAPSVFNALGANTFVINAAPDGTNINRDAGSTHIDILRNYVRANHLDVGFAFDGDADRCIAVDENGNVVDGDVILYILGNRLKNKRNLTNNIVVSTVMSNSGLAKSFGKCGINNMASAVGDQNVYDMMCENDGMLGGEQSGHIIFRKYATTGDGILTAIMILEEMQERKLPLGNLYDGLEIYPQVLKNIRVKDKGRAANDPDVIAEAERINAELNGEGRVLVRKSGTEQVVRIMAEAKEEAKCREYIEAIEKIITDKGYVSEE